MSKQRRVKPVRVIPDRLHRLRQRRARAGLAGALTVLAVAAVVQGVAAISVRSPGEVAPIALQVGERAEEAGGSRAEAALLDTTAPPAALTIAAARTAAALLTPRAEAEAAAAGDRVPAIRRPLTAAEADRALAALDLDPATREELKRLLMTAASPPPGR